MAKKIGQYAVHITDDTGELHSFLPGDEVAGWAEKKLGDHCFAGHEDDDEDEAAGDGPPPRAGKGSGVRAWRAYAEKHSVDADGLDVDEIVAELEAAGVPVE